MEFTVTAYSRIVQPHDNQRPDFRLFILCAEHALLEICCIQCSQTTVVEILDERREGPQTPSLSCVVLSFRLFLCRWDLSWYILWTMPCLAKNSWTPVSQLERLVFSPGLDRMAGLNTGLPHRGSVSGVRLGWNVPGDPGSDGDPNRRTGRRMGVGFVWREGRNDRAWAERTNAARPCTPGPVEELQIINKRMFFQLDAELPVGPLRGQTSNEAGVLPLCARVNITISTKRAHGLPHSRQLCGT